MQAVRALKNHYRGINAHLHSRWSAEGGWNEFHTNHIADLTRLMRAVLYPLGYTAHMEQSLQIRRGDGPAQTPRADVLIAQERPSGAAARRSTYVADTLELVAPIPEALGVSNEPDDYYKAVTIYPLSGAAKGEPVAWVELLSPSNKPGGQGWRDYRSKRESLLQAGIIFVELDYLHEQSPTLDIVADYHTRGPKQPPEPGAHPYRIAVIDPRPAFINGKAHVRQFDVDEPLPTLTIPLLVEDAFAFDFGVAYSKTFLEMLYGNEVDYRQLPLHFDAYSPDDQARIAARMVAVVQAAEAGVELDTAAPLPAQSIPLADALRLLNLAND
jgi:hypothetical protein